MALAGLDPDELQKVKQFGATLPNYSLSGSGFNDFNVASVDEPVWDEATQGYKDKWGNYSYDGGNSWGAPQTPAPPQNYDLSGSGFNDFNVASVDEPVWNPDGSYTDKWGNVSYDAGATWQSPGAQQNYNLNGGGFDDFNVSQYVPEMPSPSRAAFLDYDLYNPQPSPNAGNPWDAKNNYNLDTPQLDANNVAQGFSPSLTSPWDARFEPEPEKDGWFEKGFDFASNAVPGARLSRDIIERTTGQDTSDLWNKYNEYIGNPLAETGAQVTGLTPNPGLGKLWSMAGVGDAPEEGWQDFGSALKDSGGNPLEFARIQNENFGERPWYEQLGSQAVFDPTNAIPFNVGAKAVGQYGDDVIDIGRRIADNPNVAKIISGESGEATAGGASGFDALVSARKAVLDALNKNKEIRASGITAAEIAKGRQDQVQGMLGGFDAAKGMTGQAALDAMADAIPGGRLIKTTAGEIEVSPELKDSLADAVRAWVAENPGFRAYDARTARDTLNKLYAGVMPQPHEDKLLREILGDALTERVYSGSRGYNIGGAAVENPSIPLDLGADTVPVQPPVSPAAKSLTEEERGRRFFDALDAKRAEGAAFMDRLRSGEIPDRRQLSFGDEALVDATKFPDSSYDDLLKRLGTERAGDLARRETEGREFMESFAGRPNNPAARDMSLGQGGQQLATSDASKLRNVPGTGSVYTGPPLPFQPKPRTMTPAKAITAIRKNFGTLLGEAWSATRTLKSSVDLSAPLRQGAKLGWRRPWVVLGAWNDQIAAMRSTAGFAKVDALLDARPNARVHKDWAKLYRATVDDSLDNREEAFLSKWVGKLPLVAGSNRGYAAYLNRVRADSFDAVWNSLDELQKTPELAEQLGRFINVASGRGELPGVLEDAGPLLGRILYSPRNWASTFQTPWMAVTGNGSDVVRKEAMKTVAAYFTATTTLLGLGSLLGAWDVELDPRSADFGKARVGPMRYDLWTGYSQLARTAAQTITGEKKSTTRFGEDEVISSTDRWTPAIKYGRSKLAPSSGEVVNQAVGKDFKGDPNDNSPLSFITRMFGPISASDLVEAFDAYGWEMALATLPGFVGAGTQLYTPSERDKQDEKSREMFGVPFDQQTTEQRLQYTDKYGKLPPSSGKSQEAEDMTIRLTEQQKVDDAEMGASLSPEQWRVNYQDRKEERWARNDQIWSSIDFKPGKDKVVNAYYDAIDKATGANGKVDWDAVDKYRSTLDPKDDKWISDHTGYIKIDTPQTRAFEQIHDQIEASGYFERSDQNWVTVKEVLGLEGDSYYDWRDAQRKSILEAMGNDLSDVGAVAKVDKYLDKQDPAKYMEKLGSQWRDEYIVSHPQEAYHAWQFGYLEPKDKWKEWLASQFE